MWTSPSILRENDGYEKSRLSSVSDGIPPAALIVVPDQQDIPQRSGLI